MKPNTSPSPDTDLILDLRSGWWGYFVAWSSLCFFAFVLLLTSVAVSYVLFLGDEAVPFHFKLFFAFAICFWAGWLLLSILLAIGTRNARFCLSENHLIARYAFENRRIDFKEVTRVRWGRLGQCLVVENPTTKIEVNLRGYSPEWQDWLITFFRSRFPKGIQENYRQFRRSRLHVPLWSHKSRSTQRRQTIALLAPFYLSVAMGLAGIFIASPLLFWGGFFLAALTVSAFYAGDYWRHLAFDAKR